MRPGMGRNRPTFSHGGGRVLNRHRLLLFTDASYGPRGSGIGIVVLSLHRRAIWELGQHIQAKSNTEAERIAVVAACEVSREAGIPGLILTDDEGLVIDAQSPRYAGESASRLRARLDESGCSIDHVKGHRGVLPNVRADRLAGCAARGVDPPPRAGTCNPCRKILSTPAEWDAHVFVCPVILDPRLRAEKAGSAHARWSLTASIRQMVGRSR